MAFTAKDVQALREMTGVGMMDCKKALTEANGDQEKAAQILREKGMAAAAKKATRIAADGMCYAAVDSNGAGAILEVNSETDFVAKNEMFQEFVKETCNIIIKNNPADIEALCQCSYDSENTVAGVLQDLVLKIGENMQIRRFNLQSKPENAAYVHMGGKVAVLVSMNVSEDLRGNPAVNELGRDIGMQVAAMRPQWLDEADADSEVVANERSILLANALQDEKNKGKPEQVVAKIVEGRVRKYLAENCLLFQPYVKDDSVTVGAHVEAVAKSLGGEITVTGFHRYEKGEGLQKREDNFADEIAKLTANA